MYIVGPGLEEVLIIVIENLFLKDKNKKQTNKKNPTSYIEMISNFKK